MRNKVIIEGDHVYARLTMGGKTIVEFMMNTVSSMTDLIAELRRKVAGLKGLGMLTIRNQSRGWGEQRPLMLYSGGESALRSFGIIGEAPSPFSGLQRPVERHMAFPWETH